MTSSQNTRNACKSFKMWYRTISFSEKFKPLFSPRWWQSIQGVVVDYFRSLLIRSVRSAWNWIGLCVWFSDGVTFARASKRTLTGFNNDKHLWFNERRAQSSLGDDVVRMSQIIVLVCEQYSALVYVLFVSFPTWLFNNYEQQRKVQVEGLTKWKDSCCLSCSLGRCLPRLHIFEKALFLIPSRMARITVSSYSMISVQASLLLSKRLLYQLAGFTSEFHFPSKGILLCHNFMFSVDVEEGWGRCMHTEPSHLHVKCSIFLHFVRVSMLQL